MGSSSSLGQLARAVAGDVIGDPETVVHDVTHDSGQAGKGTLFVAIVGEAHDGHDFVDQARRNGANAVCVQRPIPGAGNQIVVGDTRASLGRLAADVHGHPSREIDVIGVTGTNGKTTVTHYAESLLRGIGHSTGLIGTVGSRIGAEQLPSVRTTPEASDLQRLLAKMRNNGVSKVAIEVSSHALELKRVDGTRFAVAAFTNLSQDHLDFHGSMDRYRAAKERLFRDFEVGAAVVNVDDPVGAEIATSFTGDVVSVGRDGDFSFRDVAADVGGSGFTLDTPEGSFRVRVPVLGRINVSNLALAVASAAAVGAPVPELTPLLGTIEPVPGRFEVVSAQDEPTVVVDYAHTPEGIEVAIAAAREFSTGRVIVVFGAGGDRDRAKRPLMGRAAAAADEVFVTSDNPRTEDPEAIIDEVVAGLERGFRRKADRRHTIFEAVAMSGPRDVVLILGKGHETGQEAGGAVTRFDDRVVAREALNVWRMSANLGTDSGSMEP